MVPSSTALPSINVTPAAPTVRLLSTSTLLAPASTVIGPVLASPRAAATVTPPAPVSVIGPPSVLVGPATVKRPAVVVNAIVVAPVAPAPVDEAEKVAALLLLMKMLPLPVEAVAATVV